MLAKAATFFGERTNGLGLGQHELQ
jgi:hypothetical protein